MLSFCCVMWEGKLLLHVGCVVSVPWMCPSQWVCPFCCLGLWCVLPFGNTLAVDLASYNMQKVICGVCVLQSFVARGYPRSIQYTTSLL